MRFSETRAFGLVLLVAAALSGADADSSTSSSSTPVATGTQSSQDISGSTPNGAESLSELHTSGQEDNHHVRLLFIYENVEKPDVWLRGV
ncbi:hypothetical protein JRQ81_012944 [Phrynocephalus forsythii]|uniref:Uncharacterized protein n=1 Tax=Phrynocephalus forsythii TaxID=171643 RepID=A0A9Q0XYX1_9SAUR|nr:hypothetical protein JRQ81_012944 [Phrynocephalus forsythii]